MDSFLSRLTFSFLLGQVAPGFIFTTLVWLVYQPEVSELVIRIVGNSATQASAPPWILLIFSGTLVGVVLDQLSWTGAGWQTNYLKRKGWRHYEEKVPSVVWILIGPLGVLVPILTALVCSRASDLTVQEFLPKIKPELFGQWEWLQNFYLYSAQFSSNTALALSLVYLPLYLKQMSFSHAIVLWTTIGLLQLLSIRTFDTLFQAEHELSQRVDHEGGA